MKKQLLICLIGIFILSCQAEEESEDTANLGDQNRLDVPTLLPFVEEACEEGVNSLVGLQYWTWDGATVFPTEFSSSFWASPVTLQSQAIWKTMYGYQEINSVSSSCSSYTNLNDLLSNDCIDEQRATQNPRDLRICSNQPYDRPSIQAAALSVAGTLEEAFNFAAGTGGVGALSPLALLLLPDIKYEREGKQDLALTDNAGWVLSNKFPGVANYLVFYPMSETYLATDKPPFWEVPWVINHEYGHHLFYNYLGQKARIKFGYAGIVDNAAHGGVNEHHHGHSHSHSHGLASHSHHSHEHQGVMERTAHSHHRNLDTTTREGKNDVFFTGINEGFADLFAHYSLNNSSVQMTSISCRFDFRDVSNDLLNNGLPKRFDRNDFPQSDASVCEIVDYGSVHTIGSIMASFFDRMVESAGYSNPMAKGRLLFTFLQDFAGSLEGALPDDNLLPSDLALLYTSSVFNTLTMNGQAISARQCEIVDEVFGDSFTFPRRFVDNFSLCVSQ